MRARRTQTHARNKNVKDLKQSNKKKTKNKNVLKDAQNLNDT